MPIDITAVKTEKHDDYDLDEFNDLTDGFAAATTNRRVGRCMRKAPGPSVDDGPGESASSTEESPEDLGAALIECVRATLKTRKGFDDLGQALTDQPTDAFVPEELEKLRRTIKQLDEEGTFDTPIYAVSRNNDQQVHLPSGSSVSVRLSERQRAIGISSGEARVIAVADDLPPLLQKDAALRVIAEEVEAVAAENGLHARPDSVLSWLRGWLKP